VKSLLSIMLLAPLQAFAVQLTCSEDARTNALFCFAESELREANGIRTAALYAGGPNALRKTPYTIAANCSTGVMHLKDRDGVSFGGSGPGEGTVQSRDLRRNVCAATVRRRK
jgi:hypothetical protein